jgi:hypothetical protein
VGNFLSKLKAEFGTTENREENRIQNTENRIRESEPKEDALEVIFTNPKCPEF